MAYKKKEKKVVFDQIDNPSDLLLSGAKSILPFKKILWPNHNSLPAFEGSKASPPDNKLALLGLPLCDAKALEVFLGEVSSANILPTRTNVFILTAECMPDENCFCTAFGKTSFRYSDLHIQNSGKEYLLFPLSRRGEQILIKNGIKTEKGLGQIKEILLDKEKPDIKKLSDLIGRKESFDNFWQQIADSCFGCGACTAVCPLCFCFRQDIHNGSDGENQRCLNWDSCFAKSFSEIQHHFDYRPSNKDRLYNWYHHKFRRSYEKSKRVLCTGCGRCIEACPAHLNQFGIIHSLLKHGEERV